MPRSCSACYSPCVRLSQPWTGLSVRHMWHPAFAYQPHVGVEDAIIFHSTNPTAQWGFFFSFFGFSNAFNAIKPRLLGERLEVMQADASLISWLEDYLWGKPLFVRPTVVRTTLGLLRGLHCPPFLFSLFTSDSYMSSVIFAFSHVPLVKS